MWTLRKKVEYFIHSLVSFPYFPIRVAQALGVLFALAGFAHAVTNRGAPAAGEHPGGGLERADGS